LENTLQYTAHLIFHALLLLDELNPSREDAFFRKVKLEEEKDCD
jgi:hypothetical protein